MTELLIALAILAVIVCVSIWVSEDSKTSVPTPDPIFTPQNPEIESFKLPFWDQKLDKIAEAIEGQEKPLSIGEIIKAAELPTKKPRPRPKKNYNKGKATK